MAPVHSIKSSSLSMDQNVIICIHIAFFFFFFFFGDRYIIYTYMCNICNFAFFLSGGMGLVMKGNLESGNESGITCCNVKGSGMSNAPSTRQ